MIWIASIVLGLLGLLLGFGWFRRGGSDAAGNALELGFLALGTAILLLLGGIAALGWWLDHSWLRAAPLLVIAVPVAWSALRRVRHWLRSAMARWRSPMPTAELRDLEWRLLSARTLAEIEKIGTHLASGIDLTDPAVGRSLLRTALRTAGAREKLKLLLEAGADPTDPEALQEAMNQPECLFALFEHGAAPDTRLPSGDPLVFAALDRHALELVQKLVEAGADPNLPDAAGWPLVLAHASGRRGYGVVWPFVAWLVEHGADPHRTGPEGRCLTDLFQERGPGEIDPDSHARIAANLGSG